MRMVVQYLENGVDVLQHITTRRNGHLPEKLVEFLLVVVDSQLNVARGKIRAFLLSRAAFCPPAQQHATHKGVVFSDPPTHFLCLFQQVLWFFDTVVVRRDGLGIYYVSPSKQHDQSDSFQTNGANVLTVTTEEWIVVRVQASIWYIILCAHFFFFFSPAHISESLLEDTVQISISIYRCKHHV